MSYLFKNNNKKKRWIDGLDMLIQVDRLKKKTHSN